MLKNSDKKELKCRSDSA